MMMLSAIAKEKSKRVKMKQSVRKSALAGLDTVTHTFNEKVDIYFKRVQAV